jgi:hypothetical protein
VIVFFLSVSGACKQYEQLGYVTPVCHWYSWQSQRLLIHCLEHGFHDFGHRFLY